MRLRRNIVKVFNYIKCLFMNDVLFTNLLNDVLDVVT
jgi:hypothetical protein